MFGRSLGSVDASFRHPATLLAHKEEAAWRRLGDSQNAKEPDAKFEHKKNGMDSSPTATTLRSVFLICTWHDIAQGHGTKHYAGD